MSQSTTIRVDRFFDIETSHWDQFILGGVIDAGGSYVDYTYHREDDFFQDLYETGGEVWSWNGGLYDILWFLEHCRKRGIKANVSCAGTRVTRAQVGGLVLRDAYALIPFSLLKASDMLDQETTDAIWGQDRRPSKETGLPCLCGKNCMGYCSILHLMPASRYELLAAYLRRDCQAGLAILERVRQEAEDSHYLLSGTVGGSSYRSAASALKLPKSEWEISNHYKFTREGYFGGRTQVFQPVAETGFRYDIHSAYPAALTRTNLPCGDYIRCGAEKAGRAFVRGIEGVYQARVSVPEDRFIPPLPVRLQTGRVVYPVGELAGVWTALELRHAAQHGCDIDIVGGIVWEDAQPIFRRWMRHIWDCRQRALGVSSTLSKWHKWIANSLTGKFAESPEKDRIVINPDRDSIIVCHDRVDCKGRCGPRCCQHRCTRWCGRWNPIDDAGHIWAVPFWRIPTNGHVHWAAYLTAATRIQLHDQLVSDQDSGTTSVYCDTDSVYATRERMLDVGNDLGEWGYDGAMRGFVAIAPKCYRYCDSSGAEFVRAKGLSGITPSDFWYFASGGTVTRDSGVMGLRSAARAGDGLFVRKVIKRSNNQDGIHFGDRVLNPDDGRTYPQTMKEISAWFQSQQRQVEAR